VSNDMWVAQANDFLSAAGAGFPPTTAKAIVAAAIVHGVKYSEPPYLPMARRPSGTLRVGARCWNLDCRPRPMLRGCGMRRSERSTDLASVDEFLAARVHETARGVGKWVPPH